ncbi:Crp/Fnr family transcriptional regulator [Marinilongibacter aquaticus]|uniref:Crp/Fnr family transcriptional regulator n=1 Tax=Marinilongibacter aquaticus TaxID=2975157 RepID=UPI0021BDEBC4|nr:Crp/Fnr family transcriptional regulator [Marinilongibacter aquaticus]UBM59720.1 Crp/Fnr family transcriptional regulator [Marinilongibacter aquaticus]
MDKAEILIEELRKYNPKFDDEEMNLGLKHFKKQRFKAKSHILEAGKVSESLWLAKSSVCRCYFIDAEGEEKTIWLEPECLFITDFESFIQAKPSRFSIQFYQDTEVWSITRNELWYLYENYKSWSIFGLKLMETYHVRIHELFTVMFHNNASENYAFIEEYFSDFLKVAPLKDIASMLNLSPVSISRIRSGKQLKTNS